MHISTLLQLSRRMSRYVVGLIFVCIALAFLYNVVQLAHYVPFHDWDEAIYAQVAKGFVQHPKLLLTYNGSPWFEKPPLPTLMYALVWILPISKEFSTRMVSVVLSVTTLILVFSISRTSTKNTLLALTAVFVTIQSSIFRDRSVLVNVDIFLTLGWILYVWAIQRKSPWVRMLGIIIGTLSKSVLGLLPLIAEAMVDLWHQGFKPRLLIQQLMLMFVGMLWHVIMIARYDGPFIQSHFVDHLVARIQRPIELHFGGKLFYFEKMWQELHVYFVAAIVVITYSIIIWVISLTSKQSSRFKRFDLTPKYLITVAILFVAYGTLLTLSKSKLHWYITPLLPLVGLFTAYGMRLLTSVYSKKWMQGLVQMSAWVVMGLGLLSVSSIVTSSLSSFHPADKTTIGKCIQKQTSMTDTIVYLVPPQERKDADIIQNNNLQIESSFKYGSAPAFLFYADAPVRFVYKVADLPPALATKPTILVMSASDITEHDVRTTLTRTFPHLVKTPAFCTAGQMVAFRLY